MYAIDIVRPSVPVPSQLPLTEYRSVYGASRGRRTAVNLERAGQTRPTVSPPSLIPKATSKDHGEFGG
jgi:hypothetical protein